LGLNGRRADARLASAIALVALASMASTAGCAFPLFNMEERSSTSNQQLTYTRPRGSAAEAPQGRGESTAAQPRKQATRVQTPELGPRKSSVLDPSPRPPSPPAGRVMAVPAKQSACHSALQKAKVRFERVKEKTPGVLWPVRLRGPMRGVTFATLDKSVTHAVLDCRLALRLLDWTTDLRRARVRKVEYYSAYRPGARIGGDGAVSGHAHALAIDAARFELDSGAELDVLSDWEDRQRGRAPCPLRRDEASGSRVLRGVTCRAVERKLFHVVLTPHYDRAHANHVHLEWKPKADWYYVR
jgi:hypothetical protein